MAHYRYDGLGFAWDRDAEILRLCHGKKVLHIGAADSPRTLDKLSQGLLLHERLGRVASDLVGVEIDEDAVRLLADRGFTNIRICDLNQLATLDYKPDVIVLGETIEHLMNVETCLTGLKRVMTKDTRLIISTPNCYHLYFVSMVARDYEVIHDDHKIGFTYGLLHQLLAANGLKIDEFYFTFLPRPRYQWWRRTWRGAAYLRKGFSETLLAVCRLA